MALFKVFRGLYSELEDVQMTDGHAYFCTDDGSFWIDYKDNNDVLQRKQVNAGKLTELQNAIDTKVIDAQATDDDVVILTGTDGTNAVIYDAKHAKKGPSTVYTSGNSVTSISGNGTSKTIKIPQLTVDIYGHVNAAADEEITITLPSAFEIIANATDDDVVILTAEGGANKVKYTASHAKKGPTNGYTSGNTETSISGYSDSGTIKIPQITVDEYGHVTAAGDESVTITMPAAQTIPTKLPNPQLLTIGNQSYDGSNAITVTAADLGLTGALVFLGTTTTNIIDASTTNPITVGGKSVTAINGNVVLYGNQEFMWNNTFWELLGDEGSYALKTVQVIAGNGLTGGGSLTENRTLNVGQGAGITVSDDAVSHAVPSGASSGARGTNSAGNYIRTVTTDKFGHVTGVTSDAFDINDHYTPATDSTKTLSVDASSSTAATWGSTDLVTGVNIQRDAKGHVTGVTVDSIQMPANPNTDTKVTAVGNHYTPSGTETLSTDAEAQSTNGTFYLVSGINVNRDAKGHTTSVSVDSVSDVKITTSTDASGNKVVTFS